MITPTADPRFDAAEVALRARLPPCRHDLDGHEIGQPVSVLTKLLQGVTKTGEARRHLIVGR